MFVETRRLLLRDLTVDDTDALIPAWVNDDVPRFMSGYGPHTPDAVRAWVPAAIAAVTDDPVAHGWAMVVKASGELIGWIGFGPSSRGVADVDFGYVVAPAHRGHGYCSEALDRVVRFCFEELEVGSVRGECDVDNEAWRG